MREIKVIIDEDTFSEIETMIMIRSMAGNGGTLMDLVLIKIILALNKNQSEVLLIKNPNEKETIN